MFTDHLLIQQMLLYSTYLVATSYDALVSRYEDTERNREAVVEQIDLILIQHMWYI